MNVKKKDIIKGDEGKGLVNPNFSAGKEIMKDIKLGTSGIIDDNSNNVITSLFSEIKNEFKKSDFTSEQLSKIDEVLVNKDFQSKIDKIINNKNPNNEIKQESKSGLEDLSKDFLLEFVLNKSPVPVVVYGPNGKPLMWNKRMEEETGYTFEDILKHYNEHGDVMSLLYRGENLEKVKKYLAQLKITGEGYTGVAFTMTTKSGKEKTFLWTTLPFGNDGSTFRTAVPLEGEEARKELEKTKELLRTDPLTKALSRQALEYDFNELNNKNFRESDRKKYIIGVVDIDDFKKYNDMKGHIGGDWVLKNFVSFFKENIREYDKIYRNGGDEFLLVFESNNMDEIVNKVDRIKKEFYKEYGIGLSIGVTDFDNRENFNVNEKIHLADKYMYAIKDFGLIREKLVKEGVMNKDMKEKNGVVSPVFDETNKFLGVKVLNENSEFFISENNLNIIEYVKNTKDKLAKALVCDKNDIFPVFSENGELTGFRLNEKNDSGKFYSKDEVNEFVKKQDKK